MPVPWQKEQVWQEVAQYFQTMDRACRESLDPVRTLALSIRQSLERLSEPMDELCAVSCPDCRDICCERATIWYDFKDLAYHYFAFGYLPPEQIRKIKGPGRAPCCSMLTETGCSLPRSRRPFVCTWYICPAQRSMLGTPSCHADLAKIPELVKSLRNRLEDRFCRISAGHFPSAPAPKV